MTRKESPDPDRDAKLDRIEHVLYHFPDRVFAFDEFGPWVSGPPAATAGPNRPVPTVCRPPATAPTACATSTAATPSATTRCGASIAAARRRQHSGCTEVDPRHRGALRTAEAARPCWGRRPRKTAVRQPGGLRGQSTSRRAGPKKCRTGGAGAGWGLNAARGGSSTVRTPWFQRSGSSARRGGSAAGSCRASPSTRCAVARRRRLRRAAP